MFSEKYIYSFCKYMIPFIIVFAFAGCEETAFRSINEFSPSVGEPQGDGDGDGDGDGEEKFYFDPDLPQLAPPGLLPEGLLGGHFDLDTASQVYDFNDGTTDRHIHEYDDKFQLNGADFFNLLDDGLGEINEIIASPSQQFIIIIANAQQSPGAVLEINGIRIFARDHQNSISALSQRYVLGSPSGSATKLISLKMSFAETAIEDGGLVMGETNCVRSNRPGTNGEYRNSALVIQALDANAFDIDPETGTASLMDGGLLWEAAIFWHVDDGCQ